MTQLNEGRLIEIAQKTPTAEEFFTYAAGRERNARDGITKLTQIREQMRIEGYHPVPQDLLSMFRELERAGVGKLEKDYFKWAVPIKTVGSTVTAKPAAKVATPSIPLARKNLVIYFDKSREINLQFTANLTKEEIAFVAEKLLQECTA